MANKFEYIIPGVGTYGDTSQGFEPVAYNIGSVNEGDVAAGGGLSVGGVTSAAAVGGVSNPAAVGGVDDV